jgi:hypothetical protein
MEINTNNLNLQYYWRATFKNDEELCQFSNGIENRYQLVKDRFYELKYFELYNKDNIEDKFIVDLENGFIFKNKIQTLSEVKEEKNNIRLIYFRRNWRTFNIKMEGLSHIIVYFIGFQYNDNIGNNRKIILQINKDGSFLIES